MKKYQIRHKKSGLFSNGKTSPSFIKFGKIWNSLCYVKRHIEKLQEYEPILDNYVNEKNIGIYNSSDFIFYEDKETGESLIDYETMLFSIRDLLRNAEIVEFSMEESRTVIFG